MAGELKRVGLEFKADGSVEFRKTLKAINDDMKELTSSYQLERRSLIKMLRLMTS